MAESWVLLLRELPSGRIAVDGLPADRYERMSLTYRLLDVIRAVQHADTGDDLSDGHASGEVRQGRLCRRVPARGGRVAAGPDCRKLPVLPDHQGHACLAA